MFSYKAFLENQICALTHQTPSGGQCRVGDAVFTVFYTEDLWEWEYRGVTYFDPQDLAEAILAAGRRSHWPVPPRLEAVSFRLPA